MLKLIIEIIIGVAWAAFGVYMAKKPKNTKTHKRADYTSDGKKKRQQDNDSTDSIEQDVIVESIDEDNKSDDVVAKDDSKEDAKDDSNSENKGKTFSKFTKKIEDWADYYSDDGDLGDLFSDLLEAKKN